MNQVVWPVMSPSDVPTRRMERERDRNRFTSGAFSNTFQVQGSAHASWRQRCSHFHTQVCPNPVRCMMCWKHTACMHSASAVKWMFPAVDSSQQAKVRKLLFPAASGSHKNGFPNELARCLNINTNQNVQEALLRPKSLVWGWQPLWEVWIIWGCQLCQSNLKSKFPEFTKLVTSLVPYLAEL